MRVVEQQRARPLAAQEAGEREDRGRPEVAAEGQGPHRRAGRARAGLELAARAAGDRARSAARGHAPRGEQHLVLPAAPGGGGVDVQDAAAHARGAPARTSSRSLASLAKV